MRKPGLVVWLLSMLASLFVLACGDGDSTKPDRLQIDPPTATLEFGGTATFRGQLVFGTRVDVAGPPIAWVARNPALAEVTANADGSATVKGIGAGATELVATRDGLTATAALTIGAPRLQSIGVTPANPRLARGTMVAMVATATFADSSTENVTQTATWSSANPAIASIAPDGTVRAVAIGSTTISATRDGVTGTTLVTVTDAELVSIAVTPTNPSVPKGRTVQLTATGTFSDSTTQNLTGMAAWTSNSNRVTVDAAGLASAIEVGSATITATVGAVGGSTTVTVTAATLTGIAVTPVNPSVAKGRTQAFTATGTYSDNTTQNLTTAVVWSSSNPVVATISNAAGTNGFATASDPGSSVITATMGVFSNSTTLTVTAAELVALAVTPVNPSVAAGLTRQFTAMGTFTDASVQDLTAQVAWSSSAVAIATVSNAVGSKGLATANTVGNATVTATSGMITGTSMLTVTNAALVTIGVTPVNPSLAKGRTRQFTATGTFTDASTQDLTATVTWTSSNPAFATISNAAGSNGLASALAVGNTQIRATSGAISSATTLTVTDAVLVSIGVTPAAASVAKGRTQQYTATGTFSDTTTLDLTTTVTWSTSVPATATISNAAGSNGLASTLALGNTNVIATSGAITGSTALTVTAAELASIGVTPAAPSVAKGRTRQFTATGVFTDATTQDLTTTATWASSAAGIASISNAPGSNGLASALLVGDTQISATSGAIVGNTTLTVTAAELVSIGVTPAAPSVAKGRSQQFTATGTFTDASTQDLTTTVTWSATDAAIASVSNAVGSQGLATTLAVGNTPITATSGAIVGNTTLTVTAAELVSIGVTPAAPSVANGRSQQFTATGVFTDASTQDLTTTVTWGATNGAIASVSNAVGSNGLATALTVGNTPITATSGAIVGNTTLTVTAAELVSIGVTPVNPSVANGRSQQFTATGVFTDASTQDLTTTVTWGATNAAIASVSNAVGSKGLATTLAVGDTPITATSGAIVGSTTLTVTPAVLVSIGVTPVNPSVAKGLDRPFTATGTFSDASTQDLTATVTWSSSVVTVATISNAAGSNGRASALGVGATVITAASGPITGSTNLTVTPATIVTIGVTPANLTRTVGLTVQYAATATFTDASTQDVTAQAAWSSTVVAAATVSNAVGSEGLATTVAAGVTSIRATLDGVTGATALTVTDPVLVSIAVTPANPTIAAGQTQQFTATGTYDNATTQDLTNAVAWTSSVAATATISNVAGSKGLATAAGNGLTVITATLGGISGSANLIVSDAVVVSVAVTPAMTTLAKGRTLAYVAQATYSDTTVVDVTEQAAWSSSALAVASVSNAAGSRGLVSALAVGTTVITATFDGVAGSGDLEVTAAVLEQITVEPVVNPPLPRGLTRDYLARGRFSDNTLQDLTTQVTWASSAAAVLTISNALGSQGRATAVAVGTASITATLGGVVGSRDTDVTGAVLQAIAVTPGNPSRPLGLGADFTATGTYSDATVQDLTTAVLWESTVAAVATISNAAGTNGQASTVSVGDTIIKATLGGIEGSTTLTVTPAALVTIQVTPALPSLALGRTQAFVATGVYTDGSTQNLTAVALWASSNLAAATISNLAPNQGVATPVAPGVTSISATFGGLTGMTDLTVTTAVLESIALTPANPSFPDGRGVEMAATGTYSDGSQADITDNVVWATGNPLIATISNALGSQGNVVGESPGVTTISATLDGITGTTNVTVTPAILVSLVLTPDPAAVPVGRTLQLRADGFFSDGSTSDVTASVTWTTTTPAVLSVSNVAPQGRVTGLAVGAGQVVATDPATMVTAGLAVDVTPAVLESIAVAPAVASVAVAGTRQFTATGTYSDLSTRNITNDNDTLWTSSAVATATVSNAAGGKGLATGVALGGPVTITAAQAGISGTADLTVATAPTVTTVAPADLAINIVVSTNIVVTFSAAMTPATVTTQSVGGLCTGSVQVSQDNFANCLGLGAPVLNVSNTVATVTPIPGLSYGLVYKVRVTTGAQSAGGLPLAADVTQANGFTTRTDRPCGTGLVISQVFGGGGNVGSPFLFDFIELHNTSTAAISTGGMAVQFVSAGGAGSWAVQTLPVVQIPAGAYYLIQEGGNAAVGVALPSPDFTPAAPFLIGGTSGKVALTNNNVPLVGANLTAAVIDMVGFGAGLNAFETAGAPAPSNTTSVQRLNAGCADGNNNSLDFVALAPTPRSLATPIAICACTVNETGLGSEMDFCNLQFPASTSTTVGVATENIFAQVFETGVTEAAGQGAGMSCQIGYGLPTVNPSTTPTGYTWANGVFNVQAGNNDEFRATLTVPAANSYRYTSRCTKDGINWTYCDRNGAGSNGGLIFDLPQLGTLTVTP